MFFIEIYTKPRWPTITHVTISTFDGTYTDVPVIWTLPTVVDGQYQQTLNFEPNTFYFNMTRYTPVALSILINSSTVSSSTSTSTSSSYWVISQPFICPYNVWIVAKCYDANNRFLIQVSYRNGKPSTEINLIETQTRYLGNFNVQ